MTTITGWHCRDIRFPTSRHADGSDAMNPDPDYSAAYVVLETDRDLRGHGLTFTLGKGTELCVAAVNALAPALVGKRLEVLVEGVCAESEHLLQGRHRGMAPEIDGRILINDGQAPAGTLVEVEITEAHADDLVGHITGPFGVPGIEVAADALLSV